ncbi:MAG: hypothetical protein CVU90_04980 [Firmicutes bacterium HGW-Firmicutes-15]|nr:MAG: hypothetical protein CVU90_04980 [Firmicutes bacterium HGW-Firmicutes-15]
MKKKKILLFTLTFLVLILALEVGSASAEDVTWNPNDKGAAIVLSNGNLTAVYNNSNGSNVRASEGKTQGKWYWEIKVDSANSDAAVNLGVAHPLQSISTDIYPNFNNQGFLARFYPQNTGDIYGFSLDMDSKILQISKNNTLVATKSSVAGEVRPILGDNNTNSSASYTANFGATPFVYSVPTGYQPYDGSQQKTQAPTNLAATSGDAQVTLSWIAVTDATSYKIKRAATAGGPYNEIEANIKDTSYKDTRLTNDKKYFYVVSAVSSSDESVNSTEVSATPKAASNTGNGTLIVTFENAPDKVLSISMAQIEEFISWYNDPSRVGNAYMIKSPDTGLFKSIKYYLVFDKIVAWEVRQY